MPPGTPSICRLVPPPGAIRRRVSQTLHAVTNPGLCVPVKFHELFKINSRSWFNLVAGWQRRAEGPVPSDEPLGVTVEREPVNTVEQNFRAYLTVGNDKFTFLLPEKFGPGGDAAHGRLQLESLEGNTVITFRTFLT